jgi:hypothetical protein
MVYYSKAQFFSAFQMTDEIVEEDDDIEPCLTELYVEAKAVYGVASARAIGISKAYREFIDDNISYAFETGKTIDIRNYLHGKSITLDSEVFYSLCWTDGFMNHLRIKEQMNMTWDEITKDVIKKSLINNIKVYTETYFAYKEIIRYRAFCIFNNLHGRPKPLFEKPLIAKKDKEKIINGEAVWADGFLTAGNVPFRPMDK